MSTLSEAEKQKRLTLRKPKKKVKIEEEIEDTFDQDSYSHLWKKWVDTDTQIVQKKIN